MVFILHPTTKKLASYMTKGGSIIIITAPSGAGKTSITQYLLTQLPNLKFSISATTRSPRGSEVHGVEYYFITVADFKQKIENNQFFEWEMVYQDKYYGTLKTEIDRIWNQGNTPLLDIDVKGAIQVQKQYPTNSLSIFIQPPSIAHLEKRLRNRGTETEETLKMRLNKADYEMSFKNQFDKIIINDVLATAQQETLAVITNFLQPNQ
jgi:guanylate kinase